MTQLPEGTLQPNEDQKNRHGQTHTMAGTTGHFEPPSAAMHSTVCKNVDPTSNLGRKGPSDL